MSQWTKGKREVVLPVFFSSSNTITNLGLTFREGSLQSACLFPCWCHQKTQLACCLSSLSKARYRHVWFARHGVHMGGGRVLWKLWIPTSREVAVRLLFNEPHPVYASAFILSQTRVILGLHFTALSIVNLQNFPQTSSFKVLHKKRWVCKKKCWQDYIASAHAQWRFWICTMQLLQPGFIWIRAKNAFLFCRRSPRTAQLLSNWKKCFLHVAKLSRLKNSETVCCSIE